MTHEDPVMVEGGGCPADVEHSRVLLQHSLKLLKMSRIRLKTRYRLQRMMFLGSLINHGPVI